MRVEAFEDVVALDQAKVEASAILMARIQTWAARPPIPTFTILLVAAVLVLVVLQEAANLEAVVSKEASTTHPEAVLLAAVLRALVWVDEVEVEDSEAVDLIGVILMVSTRRLMCR